jgi:putative chitinase
VTRAPAQAGAQPYSTTERRLACEIPLPFLLPCAGTLLERIEAAGWPLGFAAYGLATAAHETGRTMKPIREKGGKAYLERMYDIEGERPDKARDLGNDLPGDGVRYAGRGYVQLTGKANYRKAGVRIGYDLVKSPDLALDTAIAARILVWGMSEGWFTGRRLAAFLPASGAATFEMFRRARRIVNGTDRDSAIALLALDFQSALRAGGWQ